MNKEKNNNILTLVLGGLLVVSVFFVGRLSSQVDSLKGGLNVKGANVDTGDVVDDGNVKGANVDTGDVVDDDGEMAYLSVSEMKLTAVSLGLNEDDFNACLDGGEYEGQVKRDANLASSLGINGTPTFVINGWVLSGLRPASFYEGVIDAELAEGADVLLKEFLTSGEVQKIDIEMRGEYVKGKLGAAVEIVEFSDFECPYCTDVYPVMKGVLEKYDDEVVFEYRHLPLGFHTYAQKSAEAVECAGAQGKFWEMHDALFEAGL